MRSLPLSVISHLLGWLLPWSSHRGLVCSRVLSIDGAQCGAFDRRHPMCGFQHYLSWPPGTAWDVQWSLEFQRAVVFKVTNSKCAWGATPMRSVTVLSMPWAFCLLKICSKMCMMTYDLRTQKVEARRFLWVWVKSKLHSEGRPFRITWQGSVSLISPQIKNIKIKIHKSEGRSLAFVL